MPKFTRKIPSAIPIYLAAAIWVVYGLIRPLYRLGDILICAVLSAIACLAGRKFFPGRVEEIETAPDTGDAVLNGKLRAAQERLAQIRAFNDRLPGEEISRLLDRVEEAGRSVVDLVARDNAKASQAGRFFDYYLPTVIKLLDNYVYLENSPGGNAESIRKSVENSLEMVAAAFENLHDQMLRYDAIDVTSEISALETILAAEGLKDH